MAYQDLPADLDARHFEDYPPGVAAECGPIVVDEAEIIDFGRQFDPQTFHVDPERAATGAVRRRDRQWLAHGEPDDACTGGPLPVARGRPGSPGVDELRWLAPVRPGDRLWVRITRDRGSTLA